jgi:cation:H+ antiporter
MEFLVPVLLFALGILLIVKGGDYFVDAASWIAEESGIPKFIVGATIVSFATTLPELLVSAMATYAGDVDIAAGNAIGSVTANLGLIMGISVLCIPMAIRRADYMLKSLLMLAGTALLLVLCWNGELSMTASLLLFAIFVVSMLDNVRQAKRGMELDRSSRIERRERPTKKVVTLNIVKFIAGVIGIVLGAQLLVDYGKVLALMLGVPERIIAITLVAIGTSLPEFVTTVTALIKKEASLSVGNIIGANIIDLTLILPVCSIISGGTLMVSAQSGHIDLPVCLLVGCVALLPPLFTGKFHRWQGAAMLLLYAAYLTLTCTGIIG